MSSNGPFGFDPEEFDRVVREAGEGLRDALDGVGRFFNTSGERAGWANLVDEFTRYSRPKRSRKRLVRRATGSGRSTPSTRRRRPHRAGVPDRLDALRANKNNTDPTRKVRFLPYGIAVSVLDASEPPPTTNIEDT